MPKRSPPQTSRYQEKREAVLNAAAVLFNERGVKGATLADIAGSVGLVTNSVTYYYRKKEDLATACFMRTLQVYGELIARAATEADPEARVRALLRAQHGARLGGVFTLDMPLMSREHRAARVRPSIRDAFAPRPTKRYPSLAAALARFRFAPEQPCENLFVADHIARTSLKEVRADDGTPAWTWRFDPQVGPLGPGNPGQALREARCPVAIGWGSESALVTPPVAAYACELAGAHAPRIEIPGARHHVMVDQPLALVSALRTLLQTWPPQGR